MSERLKEPVLKTEVLIGIPGVRIPLHPRSNKLSLALYKNESDLGSKYRIERIRYYRFRFEKHLALKESSDYRG